MIARYAYDVLDVVVRPRSQKPDTIEARPSRHRLGRGPFWNEAHHARRRREWIRLSVLHHDRTPASFAAWVDEVQPGDSDSEMVPEQRRYPDVLFANIDADEPAGAPRTAGGCAQLPFVYPPAAADFVEQLR